MSRGEVFCCSIEIDSTMFCVDQVGKNHTYVLDTIVYCSDCTRTYRVLWSPLVQPSCAPISTLLLTRWNRLPPNSVPSFLNYTHHQLIQNITGGKMNDSLLVGGRKERVHSSNPTVYPSCNPDFLIHCSTSTNIRESFIIENTIWKCYIENGAKEREWAVSDIHKTKRAQNSSKHRQKQTYSFCWNGGHWFE
jgi:hypothetical protein